MWNGIGVVTDKELKLEDVEASHTLLKGVQKHLTCPATSQHGSRE